MLKIVPSDVCSIPEVSLGWSRYIVTFIDDFFKYLLHLYFEKNSDVLETFKKWVAMVKPQFELKLQPLKYDNGLEYVSREKESFLTARCITNCPTVPHNLHQNGVAKRLDRTLCGHIRSVLEHRKLSKTF